MLEQATRRLGLSTPRLMRTDPVRVLMITPTLSGNSLGRTYCLHLLCDALGWVSETWSTAGDSVWSPLATDAFAATCHRADGSRGEIMQTLIARARTADLVIAVKPLPESLGLAAEVSRATGVPLLADIDDPDLEALRADGRPFRQLGKRVLRPGVMARAIAMGELARSSTRIVSNPELQRRYGGTVVPHVRRAGGAVHARGPRTGVRVVFVGSIQPHKGIAVLRRAVGRLASEGFRLTLTAGRPEDAHQWEDWIGRTSMEEGARLAADADVVVIPSLNTTWSRGQLPVKLVDAMLSGTASIVSDVPPLPWAIGPGGIIVPAGRVDALAEALRSLGDQRNREAYGRSLRAYGEGLYTIAANTAAFAAACESARPVR